MELQQALTYIGNPVPYDVDRYHEAGRTLVANRSKFSHRIFFKIPDPGAMTTNTDMKWDEIKAGSTGERCACGNCRTIWPSEWPEFVEKETITMREGDKVYIVPEGGNYKDTNVLLEIEKNDEGKLFLTCMNDPFSDAFDILMVLNGPPAYQLSQLADAMSRQTQPAYMTRNFPKGAEVNAEHMKLFSINKASATEVVIGVGHGYVVSQDPQTQFPA